MSLAVKQNGQILYNGVKMELFVPDEFFKSGLAEICGVKYRIFGAVRALHYGAADQTRKTAKNSFLYYPAKFMTCPDSVTDEKIDFGRGEVKYKVLTYSKGSVLFESDVIIKDVSNMELFIKLLVNGKLDIVKYSKIAKLMTLEKHFTGISFGAPAMYEEVIISDYYRDPNDANRPARFAAALSDSDFYAQGVSQRVKASFTSTFSGVTYEDINAMLTMADNAKSHNREEIQTEVEKISLNKNSN